ncbi:MAG: ABC transporter permease [Chloroflexota bacterium]|nr:ABC transporter permease [Chloroflexota bacterium]
MTTAPAPSLRLRAPRRTIGEALRELRDSRQILANMVRRDFAAKHKNSFFGMAWSLVNPLLLVGIFSFVFWFLGAPVVGKRGYPFAMFFFCGITLWNLFSAGLTGATGSIVGGAYLVKKIYFPREILPLSQVFAALITFGFEFFVLMVAGLLFGVYPYWTLLFVPLIVAETFLLAYAGGLLLSGLTVVFRDIEHFIGVVIQVLFWATPIIYDIALISRKSHLVAQALRANPMVDLVLAFRAVVLDHQLPGLEGLLYAGVFGVVLYLIAARSFNRREATFAELI